MFLLLVMPSLRKMRLRMMSIPAQDLINSGERRKLSAWKGRSDNGVRFGDRMRGDTIHISEWR